MKFRGLFCGTNAATNEEYRKILKRRNWYMAALSVFGVVITLTAYMAYNFELANIPDYMLGVYCGFGMGLTLGGIILFCKNLIIMRDEEKLKKSRIENSDERLQEIGGKAMKTAGTVTLAAVLAGGLLGGIFYPVLVKALLIVLYVFFISYIIAFVIYQKRM